MRKPETAFIQSVHRRLLAVKPAPLILKVANRYTTGWPDVLYISPMGATLWVEYKVWPYKPTTRQQLVMDQLSAHKQNVAVITKHPTKVITSTNEELQQDTVHHWILEQLKWPT
jgi:hypothetical protein